MITGRRVRWLAAALLVPLYLWIGLANRDLWAPDEPRYALVAREMAARDGWLVPTVNGAVYAHKPPLLFWAIRCCGAVTGRGPDDPLAARLPSALAALATLAVTLALGRRLHGEAAAWTAVLVLATSHMFCWEAHTAQMDSLLALWVALAMLCLVEHRAAPRTATAVGFGLTCALGTLTKGPVALAIPGLVAALWLADDRPARAALFRPAMWVALLAPLVAWLAPAAAAAGPGYLDELVGRHVVTRYFASWHHVKPAWFYLADLPLELLPWSLVLPAAIAYARRTWGPGERLATLWIGAMLVLFSFTSGKRGLYMLPAFPALALLIGATLEDAARRPSPVRSLALGGLALAPVLFAAVYALADVAAQRAGVALDTSPVEIAALAGLAALFVAELRHTVVAATRATALAATLTWIALYGPMLAQLDSGKSPREFCRLALALRQPGEPLGFFGPFLESYALFTGEKLLAGERAVDYLPHGAAPVLTFAQREHFEELAAIADTQVLARARIGDKDMVLARIASRAQP